MSSLLIEDPRNIRIASHKTQPTIVKALRERYLGYLKDTTCSEPEKPADYKGKIVNTASSRLSDLFDNDRSVSRALSFLAEAVSS